MRLQRRLVVVLIAVCLFAAPLTSAAPPARPKLVVLLVVDQMSSFYTENYRGQWKAGLARLLKEGAWFQEAAYPYANTVTCVGHTTISTGAFPSTHGIVGNSWFDRQANKSVPCTDDPSKPLIGYQAPVRGGNSASRLQAPTFSDELRAQTTPAPRVVTLSIKDRTAITLAGRQADAATWLSTSEKTWVTSTAYTSTPVPFVERFTKANPVESELSNTWSLTLPAGAYKFADDAIGEQPISGWTKTFPHPLKVGTAGSFAAWDESPFSDAYLERMAVAAVDEYQLGRGAGIDLLAISFTALDLVGHDFGPRSFEVQDVLVRLDQTIGRLLAHLDARVGRSNYVVALTADHGVAPIPEQVKEAGDDAGRVLASDVLRAAERSLITSLGTGTSTGRFAGTDIYLPAATLEKLNAARPAVEAMLGAIRRVPGVAEAFWTSDLPAARQDADRLKRAAALSFFPGRSGDVMVIPKPNWSFTSSQPTMGGGGTTHGTPNAYDQRVPLLLMGSGIKPGLYKRAVTPADVTPTLAALCGITMPLADGKPLAEAMVTPTTK
jgi:predicted AlkP superfamily pyrophosphatase or phosphodiesterase